jgi:hypothetical protein
MGDFKTVTIATSLMIFMVIGVEACTGPAPQWYIEDLESELQNLADQNETVGTEKVSLTSEDGRTVEGGSSEVQLDMGTYVVFEIDVRLAWTDDFGDNDEFGLSLLHDGDVVDETSGSSGTLEISYSTGTEAVPPGNYSVEVAALDCPGVVGMFPVDRDDGNDWSLDVDIVVETRGGGS